MVIILYYYTEYVKCRMKKNYNEIHKVKITIQIA